MEFIAMTGCLSGTKRSSGNFLRDFKGGGMVRTRGGCSYGYGGSSVLWWGTAGSWGRLVRRGGHWFAPAVGAPTVQRRGGIRFFGGGTAGSRDRLVRRGGH